jgi:ankyrin repeat protein
MGRRRMLWVMTFILLLLIPWPGKAYDLLSTLSDLHYDQAMALIRKGADIHAANDWGETPLLLGAPHPDVVNLLLERGADPNRADQFGLTPLHKAVGHKDSVLMLLEQGAKVNAANVDGETPLHAAVKSYLYHELDLVDSSLAPRTDGLEVIEILLNAGADINASGTSGATALHLAAKFETIANLGLIEFLVAKGAAIHQGDHTGKTPIHYAVEGYGEGYVEFSTGYGFRSSIGGISQLNHGQEVIARLLDLGADVNARDHEGMTPLHLAARAKEEGAGVDMILILLGRGAEINAKALNGRMPIHYASNRGNDRAVEVLESAGAEQQNRVVGRVRKNPNLAYLPALLVAFILHLLTWHICTQRTDIARPLGAASAGILYLAILAASMNAYIPPIAIFLYYLAYSHVPLIILSLLFWKLLNQKPEISLLNSYIITTIVTVPLLLWSGPMHQLVFWLEKQGFDYNLVHPFLIKFTYIFFYALIGFTIIRILVKAMLKNAARQR